MDWTHSTKSGELELLNFDELSKYKGKVFKTSPDVNGNRYIVLDCGTVLLCEAITAPHVVQDTAVRVIKLSSNSFVRVHEKITLG